MRQDEFRALFERALERAADHAEEKLHGALPRSFEVELHSPAAQGLRTSVGEAVERMYLGPDTFFRLIDVAIKERLPGKLVAFVRVSGHAPAEFDKTWDPSDLGPFKELVAEDLAL